MIPIVTMWWPSRVQGAWWIRVRETPSATFLLLLPPPRFLTLGADAINATAAKIWHKQLLVREQAIHAIKALDLIIAPLYELIYVICSILVIASPLKILCKVYLTLWIANTILWLGMLKPSGSVSSTRLEFGFVWYFLHFLNLFSYSFF